MTLRQSGKSLEMSWLDVEFINFFFFFFFFFFTPLVTGAWEVFGPLDTPLAPGESVMSLMISLDLRHKAVGGAKKLHYQGSISGGRAIPPRPD